MGVLLSVVTLMCSCQSDLGLSVSTLLGKRGKVVKSEALFQCYSVIFTSKADMLSFSTKVPLELCLKLPVINAWTLILQDRREFAKFEKERQNAQWDTVSRLQCFGR